MKSFEALAFAGVFAVGLFTQAGCAGDPSDGAAESGEDAMPTPTSRTIAASSTTQTELGIDHWGIARRADNPTLLGALMTGYSVEGDAARTIKVILRTGDKREAMLEVSIGGQPVASARTAAQADGSIGVVSSDLESSSDAQKTIARFSADFGTAYPSTDVEPSAIRFQSPLVGGAGSGGLIKEGPFIDCMETLHPLIGRAGLIYQDVVRICSPLSG